MGNKSVLLIDEDDVVLSLLQKSLIGNNPAHKIVPILDPDQALAQLKLQHFDVIISDLPLLTSRETHILDAIISGKQSAAKVIATAYNYQRVAEVNVGDLNSVTLLPKPIRMNDLMLVIERIFGKPNELNPEQSAAAEAQQKLVGNLLEGLRENIHARCILLSDASGNIIHKVGNLDGIPIDAITSLLCGGVATLVEAGRNIDESVVINLAFREGKNADLYAINIGIQLVLIIVIDKGHYYERLGSVWFYARKAAVELSKSMEMSASRPSEMMFEGAMDQAVSAELDKLFG
jgi:ActR/RegA family two-component response regulator